jgi:hypothetical protein
MHLITFKRLMIVGMERDLCSGGLMTLSLQFGSTKILCLRGSQEIGHVSKTPL